MKAQVSVKEGKSYKWGEYRFTEHPTPVTDPEHIKKLQAISVLVVSIEEDRPVQPLKPKGRPPVVADDVEDDDETEAEEDAEEDADTDEEPSAPLPKPATPAKPAPSTAKGPAKPAAGKKPGVVSRLLHPGSKKEE